MAKAPTTTAVTEKVLTARLRGLSKADIKSVAGVINRLQGGGLKPDDVFPIGIIINNPDGAEVRGHASGENLAEILKLIPAINPRSVTIFPRGIVAPDNFRVHIKLGGGADVGG